MLKTNLERISIKDVIMIAIGTGLYGWGLINVNIPNRLAEGGISGITLILKALFNWNPAYTTFILNIPLLFIGYRILGRRALIYTIWGITSLSIWLYIWQVFPTPPALNQDMLIAGLIAGIVAGAGLGIVFRFGGTSGGTDVVARIMEQKFGIQIGRTMFALDAVVLLLSLVYIDIVHMMYTLIASFVFTQVLALTQQGAYTARSFMIFTDHPEEISHAIMAELERGTSLLKSEGVILTANNALSTLLSTLRKSTLFNTLLKKLIQKRLFQSLQRRNNWVKVSLIYAQRKNIFSSKKGCHWHPFLD